MVFLKQGGLLSCERWNYYGQITEAVNNFKYLYVVFKFTGNLDLNQRYLVGQSLEALNIF